MRIRQNFGRQESSDSKCPLINTNDDTDASTLSLASQKISAENSNNGSISRNSSTASTSKLSRPMAVIVSVLR